MNCPPADSWFTPELLYYTNFMNYRQYDSDHPRSFSLTGLKLPKTHQTPDRKVFFIWFCCFIPKNKERKFQSTEANHNIWHSINCYASLFLSSENSSQIQMCDFSQCKLNGMLWNFSRSIFKRNQAVVSVALPIRAVCCTTGSQTCWFVMFMIMSDPGAALGLQRSFKLKQVCGMRRCMWLRALTPFTIHRLLSFIQQTDL